MNGLTWVWCGLIALLLTAEVAAQPASLGDVADPDNAPLPRGALSRLGSLRLRAGEFLKLAFLPDGKSVVMSGISAGIGSWDLVTGHQQRCYWRSAGGHIALSRDGKLVMGGSNLAWIWETTTGKELHRIENSASDFAFSPDGTHLAVGRFNEPAVRLLDVTTLKEIGRLDGHKKGVTHLAFSPDGKWLASYDEESFMVHLWEVAARKQQACFKVWLCRSLAFAAGGNRLITASADGKLRVWDVPNDKLERVLAEQKEEVWHVVASADGGMVAATLKDGIHVWDAAAWKELRRWDWGRWDHPLAFSPDGKTLATARSGEGTPRFWDIATGEELRPTRGHHGPVGALAFSADGKTLWSLSSDHTARAWDWRAGTETKCLSLGPTYANHLALAPNRKTAVVAWHNERRFHLWDLAAGKSLGSLDAPGGALRTQVISPDSRLLAWQSWDRKIHVQPVAGGEESHEWPSADSSGLAFSSDGATLVFGEKLVDGVLSVLHVRDLKTGKERRRVEIPGNIACTSASPDGRVWATTTFNGSGGELRLWDTETWKLLYLAGEHEGCPMPHFSPDSRLLALPNLHRNSLRVLEVATGKEVRMFDGMRDHAKTAAFTPDGRVLAVADGNSTIIVWDLTGRLKEGKLSEVELGPAELAARWTDLAGAEAARAFDAVWAMVASPRQSVPFLAKHLQPATAPAEAPKLIRDLDSDDFDTRDRAWRALLKLGEAADPALRAALGQKLTLEVQRRIEQLVDRPRLPLPAGDDVRGVRAIQVLESIGNPEAQRHLRTLADGADGARLTQDARAALGRLARRAILQ